MQAHLGQQTPKLESPPRGCFPLPVGQVVVYFHICPDTCGGDSEKLLSVFWVKIKARVSTAYV